MVTVQYKSYVTRRICHIYVTMRRVCQCALGLELLSALHLTLPDGQLKTYVSQVLDELVTHGIIQHVKDAHKKGAKLPRVHACAARHFVTGHAELTTRHPDTRNYIYKSTLSNLQHVWCTTKGFVNRGTSESFRALGL